MPCKVSAQPAGLVSSESRRFQDSRDLTLVVCLALSRFKRSDTGGLLGKGQVDVDSRCCSSSLVGPREYAVWTLDVGCKEDRAAATLWHLSKAAPLVLIVRDGRLWDCWFATAHVSDARVLAFIEYAESFRGDLYLHRPTGMVRIPEISAETGARADIVYFNPFVFGDGR